MTAELTQKHIEENLLSETESLFNHIFWVEETFAVEPSNKKHRKTSIKFNDIKERREDFLRELVSTTVSWVYNKEKVKKILDERLASAPNDIGNALNFLTLQAFSKFRPDAPQGQFGELLLFNFIQYFFKATPLLRKQAITTSKGHERFGADAIHYKKDGIKNAFIVGEVKCYTSKYKFKTAFKKSLTSIVSAFEGLDKELDLYYYDDFIEPSLEKIAKEYKKGILTDVHYELVCLIAYHENIKLKGSDEESIKQEIISVVKNRCTSLEKKVFDAIDKNVLDRIHYIFFPIFDMDSLLNDFSVKVGSKS